ncbi:undecaprenyl/decaprenyl-phosphate alpha-N-acetylglucosaminyl 1-phosphate transferase [Pelagibacteraceae bacterium]|jgi:UDP-N-acetylmuramyl pentapeptide phosphotransferase/UDP-N-acetylglucosamine-1-phosphate transferase|nr:undecaprenyl/decaprenyl-phosphate alpha-N-acetylglucosaminyl 1-phosphate transferase [Pelagibacteraceae bacterium]
MIELIIFSLFNLTAILMSNYCIKKKILLNQSGEKHQQFVEKSQVPLIGGIYFLISFIYILDSLNNYFLILFAGSIFLVGLYSDLNLIRSPKKRFFIQCMIVLFFIYFLGLKIISTRVEFLDKILDFKIFNLLFILFCLTVLINGTNFIDGLNGLVIGYYLILTLIMLRLNFFENLNFSIFQVSIIINTFFIMFFMNLKKILFLGDSGSYLIGLIFGILLISHQQNFNTVSPYFVVLLFWYPCFENLFSIIRKFNFKRSPIMPDNEHLHQVLFFYIKKKFSLSDLISNNISTIIVLLFTFLTLHLGSLDIYSTKLQLSLILIFSIVYFISYIKLISFKKNFLK